jgi:catechol 2,3-dioxygenase-like lactoylglutathione lyase family enzyme
MQQGTFDVGGVWLPQPFRIRRLGHFGINVHDPERSLDFYQRLLGLRVSDPIDFGWRLSAADQGKFGPTRGYFMRHATDHHSFVLFPRRVMEAVSPHFRAHPQGTVNQITWQVGSLQEVVRGFEWFESAGRKVLRAGRDIPGSNWHFYPPDPDGNLNELYYGIEQIGWSGHAKPRDAHKLRHETAPTLPQRSEYAEVSEALQAGLRADAGLRSEEAAPEVHDVEGVLLARPFKITRIGPVRLFVEDVEQVQAFYRDALGLRVTEEVMHEGHRCVFLRANTEHHSVALYPLALREQLGLSASTTLMSFGFQLGSYTQLKQALAFLQAEGVTIRTLPPALCPGMDYQFFALDPDGHAIQFYYRMDQIGWDGRPRPPQTVEQDPASWPAVVAAASDVYQGEAHLGPLN